VKSSSGYTVDTTSPLMGQVLDGIHEEDSDYLVERTSFSAHWVGFNDPHSDILEYEWAIGSCTGCTDIQGFVSVGLLSGTVHIFLPTYSYLQFFFFTLYRVNKKRSFIEGWTEVLHYCEGLQLGRVVYCC